MSRAHRRAQKRAREHRTHQDLLKRHSLVSREPIANFFEGKPRLPSRRAAGLSLPVVLARPSAREDGIPRLKGTYGNAGAAPQRQFRTPGLMRTERLRQT